MEENKTECVVVSSVQDLGRVDFDTNYSLQIEDGVEVDRVLSSETFVSDTKFDILDKKAVLSANAITYHVPKLRCVLFLLPVLI